MYKKVRNTKMNIYRVYYILLLIFVFNSASFGQEALSLSDAINKAVQNNYDVKIIKRDQKITDINNSWGAAGRYPSFNFELASNNQSNYNDAADYTLSSNSATLSMNWVLFDGFSIYINKRRLDYLSSISEGNTAILIENTIQNVIKAYYLSLLEKEKLTVMKELMDLSKDRYDYTLTKKDIGSSVTYDVLLAKTAWLEDKSNFLYQEVQYKNSIRDLNYLLGNDDEKEYNLTDKFKSELKNYEIADLLNKMLKNNRSLKNQYIYQSLLEKETSLAKSQYLPSVTLRSGATITDSRRNTDGTGVTKSKSKNLYANLSLSLSLFDGGAKKRAVEIAKIEEDIKQIEIDEMKNSLSIELKNIFGLYNVRKELLRVADENLEAAKLNMQISGDKFRTGVINSFNYRDVQLIYLNSSINRLNAIFNLIDTHTALIRITGGIISEYEN